MRLAYLRVAAALLLPALFSIVPSFAANAPLGELFAERINSVVAVEFFVETEIDRRPSTVFGMVADDDGLVVLLDSSIPGWLPPSQLKDFLVYAPGTNKGVKAEYLGQDFLNGWHFIRPVEKIKSLVPVTKYETNAPILGDEIWGIGLMAKEFSFQPYLLTGLVSVLQQLPQKVGFSVDEVTGPGSLVFSRAGALVGWGSNPVPDQRLLYMDSDRYNVRIQNPNATGGFLFASEVIPFLDRVPAAPIGEKVPWLGVVGLRSVEREVADFLELGDNSAVVVSEVVKDGPAQAAGIEKRDIIVSVDGEPFPRFNPENVVVAFFERKILAAPIGKAMRLGVVRGSEQLEFDVTIGRQPKSLKEAERRYFERLGITMREFVLFDKLTWQLEDSDDKGIVVSFVKPNSQAGAAGLRVGDLVTAVDGQNVDDYSNGIGLVEAIETDEAKNEFVLLTKRGTETSLIRVRLN
jgi:serine protease Do